jgi:sRNA-binding carbon storage regulator CsrA
VRARKENDMGLSITRRVNEWVLLTVGEVRIYVRLDSASPNRAQLTFEAPGEVKIVRGELLTREVQPVAPPGKETCS